VLTFSIASDFDISSFYAVFSIEGRSKDIRTPIQQRIGTDFEISESLIVEDVSAIILVARLFGSTDSGAVDPLLGESSVSVDFLSAIEGEELEVFGGRHSLKVIVRLETAEEGAAKEIDESAEHTWLSQLTLFEFAPGQSGVKQMGTIGEDRFEGGSRPRPRLRGKSGGQGQVHHVVRGSPFAKGEGDSVHSDDEGRQRKRIFAVPRGSKSPQQGARRRRSWRHPPTDGEEEDDRPGSPPRDPGSTSSDTETQSEKTIPKRDD
jgi:hypothetical protein